METIGLTLLNSSNGNFISYLPDSNIGARKTISLKGSGYDVTVNTSNGTFGIGNSIPNRNLITNTGWNLISNELTSFVPEQQSNLISGFYGNYPSGSLEWDEGTDVAISQSGNVVAFSSINYQSSFGTVWVFRNINGTYIQDSDTPLSFTNYSGSPGFGSGISLSSDGSILAVGAAANNNDIGGVWILRYINGIWIQDPNMPLVGSYGLSDPPEFGFSVSLSADGNILATTGINYDAGSNNGGGWVFNYIGGQWVEYPRNPLILPNIGYTGTQGYCIAISGDGTTIALGSNTNNIVITFLFTGENWSNTGILSPSTTTGYSSFWCGYSVSLSYDGTVLAAGDPQATLFIANTGGVFIWTYSSTTGLWTQYPNYVYSSDYSGSSNQGISVSISYDGNTLVSGDNGMFTGVYSGAFYIFSYNGTTWNSVGGRYVGSNSIGNPVLQGSAVAISGNATTIIESGPANNNQQGGIWLFGYTTSWNQLNVYPIVGLYSNGTGGFKLTLSANGTVLAVGVLDIQNYNNNTIGGVFVYMYNNEWIQYQITPFTGSNYTGSPAFGTSLALSSDGLTLAIGGPGNNSNIGGVWIWNYSNGVWNQYGTGPLVGTGYSGTPKQGTSVALSSNGTTLVSGGPNNSTTGGVWIFNLINSVWTQYASNPLIVSGYSGQGSSVSLSPSGNILAVGASTITTTGGTFIWNLINNSWISYSSTPIVGSGYIGSPLQGTSVSLSSSGNVLAIGGPGNNTNIGGVWIFNLINGIWTQYGTGPLVGTGYTGTPKQGTSIQLTADGCTLVIGGPGVTAVGNTWVFAYERNQWIQKVNLIGSGVGGNSNQGNGVAVSSTGSVLSVGGPSTGNIWIYN